MALAGAIGGGNDKEKEKKDLLEKIAKMEVDDNYNQTKIRRLRNKIFGDILNISDEVRNLDSDLNAKYNLMKSKVKSYVYDEMDHGDPLNLEAELGIDGKENHMMQLI